MQQSSPKTIAVLVAAFVIGIAVVLLVTGGDDDEPGVASATSTQPVVSPPLPSTTSTGTRTTGRSRTSTTSRTTTSPPVRTSTAPPVLESKPADLRKKSEEAAKKAAASGSRTCPDFTTPARVVDITADKVSCATARKVVFATTPAGKRGFACDIVGESFEGDPQIEYDCKRKADGAALHYTAVG